MFTKALTAYNCTRSNLKFERRDVIFAGLRLKAFCFVVINILVVFFLLKYSYAKK